MFWSWFDFSSSIDKIALQDTKLEFNRKFKKYITLLGIVKIKRVYIDDHSFSLLRFICSGFNRWYKHDLTGNSHLSLPNTTFSYLASMAIQLRILLHDKGRWSLVIRVPYVNAISQGFWLLNRENIGIVKRIITCLSMNNISISIRRGSHKRMSLEMIFALPNPGGKSWKKERIVYNYGCNVVEERKNYYLQLRFSNGVFIYYIKMMVLELKMHWRKVSGIPRVIYLFA